MQQIGQGNTADILAYEDNTVLKLYRDGFPEDAIRHEYQVSQLVYALGIRTPQPFRLDRHEHRQGIVFQRISGESLLRLMVREPPEKVQKLSWVLADIHHKLHEYEVAGSAWRQQKQALRHSIEEAPDLRIEERSAIVRYLEKLPAANRLCHGDFHPDNVMIGEKEWIMDWMTGMSGHPAGDVARTLILLRYGTMPSGTPEALKEAVGAVRSMIGEEYFRRYAELSGLAPREAEDWMLPVAAARLGESIPPEERTNLLEAIRERLSRLDFQEKGT